ncbi:stalk domain-containing protein [Cohnella hashimotonis]|uniref:Stalk domain-containing protein n=1 Tax=Cohnella hashimotonis TaxID=2826895 RepID=A0ABT6TSS5_9BACL|nr:stalk domain-containing protein [Cohnella hashimotonis]MDI4649897.1 stalk domain-containing protein [Cohnella hashimotonis]
MIGALTGINRKWIAVALGFAMLGQILFGWAPQKAGAAEAADESAVAVRLIDSQGHPLAGASVDYYDAGWKTFGTTDASGTASKALPDKSYTFHVNYEGTRLDIAQDTGVDPVVVFQTVNVKLQLKDSQGNPLSGGVASYYATGWKTFGDVTDGEVSKELLPGNYTFHVDYEGTRLDIAQDTGVNPVVDFKTVNVKLQLKDSQGNPLSGGVASYYATGWKTFGDVTGGEVGKELLPGNYTFHVDYEGTRMDKAQDTGVDPVVVFRTVNAKVRLTNQTGYPLSGGAVSYYATGWRTFGTTANGEASKQLLPGSYTFAMNYGGKTTEKVGDLSADPTVAFQVSTPSSVVVAPKQSHMYDPIPQPPNERPRVLVNKNTLPALKARVTDAAFDDVWASINTKAQRNVDGNLPPRTGTAFTNVDPRMMEVMKANAVRYLIYGDEAAGQKAVRIAVNMAKTVEYITDRSNSTTVFNVARDIGSLIFFESIAYDWTYDLMNEEQRTTIQAALGHWVKTGLEYPYPMDERQKVIIAGHANGEVHHSFKLAMGIALYDTNPEYYNDIADYLLNIALPGFNVLLDGEMPFEGPAYGDNRMKTIMMGNQLWKAIGIEPLTEKVGLALDRLVYIRRPDGNIMTEGDDFNTAYEQPWKRFLQGNITTMIAGSVYNNPRAQYEFLKQNTYLDELYYLLFFNPDAPSQSVYDTPLSRYFPAPYGSIVARTGWDEGRDSNAVVAVMNIGERTQSNHQHVDPGAFSLYYKGNLAIDSGMYSGVDPVTGAEMEYNSVHDLDYHKETTAHNVVQIGDATDLFFDRYPKSVEQWNTEAAYQRGKIISHAIGDDETYPDYSYIKGELSAAYSKTNTDHYTRSMAFLNFKDDEHPAAMLVYDNIDTPDAGTAKKWLLHTIGEPIVEGGRYTSVMTEQGYNGKLVTDTLLPKSDALKVDKIGGPGHEFEVNGVNKAIRAASPTSLAALEAGQWRLELSDKTPVNRTQFLNVMQVMDAVYGPAPQDVYYSETDDYAGARIYDRVVFFAKDFDLTDDEATIAFTGEADQRYKILVTDLADGYWTVAKEGETATVKYKVVNEGNTLYFEGTPGTYTLHKADSSALPLAGKVASEPLERKIRVRIDGQGQPFGASSELAGGVPMIPMQDTLEALGLQVEWNESAQTAKATKEGLTIELAAGSATATVNGESKPMEVPATVVNGQMRIPLGFITQSTGYKTSWDAESLVAEIYTLPPVEKLPYERKPLAPVTPIPIGDLKEVQYQSYTATVNPDLVPKLFDNVQANASRWAGDLGANVVFDFGSQIQLERLDVAVYNGHTRSSRLMFSVSNDGENWTNVYGGDTIGDTSDFMPFNFPSLNARYFRLAVFGSTDGTTNPEWVSISELKFFVKK